MVFHNSNVVTFRRDIVTEKIIFKKTQKYFYRAQQAIQTL